MTGGAWTVGREAWDTVLSSLVGGGRRWLTDRLYQWLILGCGFFMAYLGLQFLLTGISLWIA